ncbi:MAG: ATP-binding protein [Candidatus Methylarchaceae archaeon HK02M1]|nr:ATP-binding protein [Candidatus Methylarchaceae archaeon HK02M1]
MIISVASGKGGTGKTTVAVNMALSLEKNVQILDCDVEEPNVHIFIDSNVYARPVYMPRPKINEELCDYCGRCSEFCEFHAIAVVKNKVIVFPELCHNCGGCALVCPKSAITEENREVGVVRKGVSGSIEFVYGELNVGELMSVPVINEVKKEIDNFKTVIIDTPPGTSCPVINSIYGSDYCILVTEPTPFGLHDLRLIVDVLREVKISFGVLVNRVRLGDRRVYDYCEKEGIPILLEIPFDRKIAELYSRGTPFVQVIPEWKERFLSLFWEIEGRVGERSK